MKKMTVKVLVAVLALALGSFALMGCGKDSDVIKIGFNLEPPATFRRSARLPSSPPKC